MLTIGKVTLKAADTIIIIAAIALASWLYSIFWFERIQEGDAETLLIQVADNPPTEYSLNEERIITVEGVIGASLIEVKHGKARFIHSVCRNKFCVFHGWISVTGDSTACLPNRVSISLKGKLSNYDAIAGSQ